MAGPAQLVLTLSETTGVPLATVTDIDRKLVMGGLRRKGGRGLSAARMTALDAARLLTAMLASSQTTLSVAAVTRYAKTRVDRARSSDDLFGASGLSDLASLSTEHSFVDGVAALIASAEYGALARLVALADRASAVPNIEVFAFTEATYGRIRLSGLPNRMTVSIEYLPVPTPARGRRTQTAGRGTRAMSENPGDLEQSRRVTERTILAVANLLVEKVTI
jgi:hypothetical protein